MKPIPRIQLFVEPLTVPMPFSKFRGPYKLALDGYVSGPPEFNMEDPSGTCNHHEGVDPLATRSTTGQIQMVIRQGLIEQRFRDKDGPRVNVFVNDCDQDVCTAWALILWHWRTEIILNPRLNRLVDMEDKLDCTAGAYPYPRDMPMLRNLAWIFEPYNQFRLTGQLDRRDARAYRCVIDDVVCRIGKHIDGDEEEIPLEDGYDTLGRANGWTIVRETGAQARTRMLSEGLRRVVSVRERPDGRYVYSILKFQLFDPYSLPGLCGALNRHEGIATADIWGGRPNAVGSPRVAGTSMDPDQMARFLETHDPRGIVTQPSPSVVRRGYSFTQELDTRLQQEFSGGNVSAGIEERLRFHYGMPPRPPTAEGAKFRKKAL